MEEIGMRPPQKRSIFDRRGKLWLLGNEPETPVPEGTIGPVATWIPHSSVNGTITEGKFSLPGLDPSETQVTLYATVFGSGMLHSVGHEIIQIDLKLNETTQEWESETTSFAQDLGTPPDSDSSRKWGNLLRYIWTKWTIKTHSMSQK